MKAVFLDRDGVINRYPGDGNYVTSLKNFRFLPKAKAAIALLTTNGYAVIVISNQAGVGKGVYPRSALDEITSRMKSEVEKAGGTFKGIYYCTHRPGAGCTCRKPRAGMIIRARADHRITGRGIFFIGDTIRDVHTARAGGCKAILVLSGKEKWADRGTWDTQPDLVFRDLYRAAEFIVSAT